MVMFIKSHIIFLEIYTELFTDEMVACDLLQRYPAGVCVAQGGGGEEQSLQLVGGHVEVHHAALPILVRFHILHDEKVLERVHTVPGQCPVSCAVSCSSPLVPWRGPGQGEEVCQVSAFRTHVAHTSWQPVSYSWRCSECCWSLCDTGQAHGCMEPRETAEARGQSQHLLSLNMWSWVFQAVTKVKVLVLGLEVSGTRGILRILMCILEAHGSNVSS